MLAVPTGSLIAGDPSELYGDARPLTEVLPPGECVVRAELGSVEVRPAGLRRAEEPVRWERRPGFATPSGHLALLDAAALAGFTDVGDEPVDEYELLAERFAAAGGSGSSLEFGGLLILPCAAAVGEIRLGYAASGGLVRIILRYEQEVAIR